MPFGNNVRVWSLIGWLALSTAHAGDAGVLQETVLQVSVNEQTPEMVIALRDDAGNIWLEEGDFSRFRLKVPVATPYAHEEQSYLPLAAIEGLSIQIDAPHQQVNVNAPAEAFTPVRMSAADRSRTPLTPSAAGGFLNYQLSEQRIQGSTYGGAYAELGMFAAAGVLTNTVAFRNAPDDHSFVRLDTSFVHDFPDRIERLVIGDAISDAGTWGSAVRFGGINWGRDFSLRPDLITAPLLSISGSAVVPSTADIFVNNQKVASENLPPGPFIVDRLPAITGSGQVSVVVRDALGREQRISQAFYSSPTLLSPGLSQYSTSVGRVREDYNLASNRYGNWLGAGTYRRGLTSNITLEGHGEFLADTVHAVGIDLATRVGHWGVLNMMAAQGGGQGAAGSLLGLGFENQGTRFSFSLSTAVAEDGYRQLSSAINGNASQFKQRDLAQVGLNAGRAGSVAIAYARQRYFSLPDQRTYSLSYNWTLRDWLVANLAATHVESNGYASANSYFLNFTIPLSSRRVLTTGVNGGNGDGAPQDEVYATLAQNPPVGPGFGYRIGATTARNYDLDGRWQTDVGDLDAQASRNQNVEGQSLFWSGAATLLDGELHASRTARSSFAIVDVGGIANVPVYIDHQLVTHTDESGRALLPDLLPYQPNRINIEPTDLPLDTKIDTRTYVLVPGYRSGVIARFPVERIRAGTFRLITADGRPVPAGAQVKFNGKLFPVGYDGTAYVTGYDHGMGGTAIWMDGACEFRVEPPPVNDPLPDLGTIECIDRPNRVVSTP